MEGTTTCEGRILGSTNLIFRALDTKQAAVFLCCGFANV